MHVAQVVQRERLAASLCPVVFTGLQQSSITLLAQLRPLALALRTKSRSKDRSCRDVDTRTRQAICDTYAKTTTQIVGPDGKLEKFGVSSRSMYSILKVGEVELRHVPDESSSLSIGTGGAHVEGNEQISSNGEQLIWEIKKIR
jgi:hypothetical protein